MKAANFKECIWPILGRKFIIANARTANCAIIYANDGFCNLTGFSRSDIMQKSCWCEFLYGRRTAPSAVAEMKTCMQTKLEVNCEITLYRQNSKSMNAVMLTRQNNVITNPMPTSDLINV